MVRLKALSECSLSERDVNLRISKKKMRDNEAVSNGGDF